MNTYKYLLVIVILTCVSAEETIGKVDRHFTEGAYYESI